MINNSRIVFVALFFVFFGVQAERPQEFPGWSLWSVSKELFYYIRSVLPEGGTMLELGSGFMSKEFSKFYTVYSIEHDKHYIGRYNTNYIYAPIKNGWYSIEALKEKLPAMYDLILIDGPT